MFNFATENYLDYKQPISLVAINISMLFYPRILVLLPGVSTEGLATIISENS